MAKTLTPVQADWRERKFERNRVDILEAAARAFANKGLAGATMQDIAAEAGYTVPTLYAYFKSKDEIGHALMMMLHRELLDSFDTEPIRGLTFAQNLELLVRKAFEMADRRRATLTLLLQLGGPPKGCGEAADCPSPRVLLDVTLAWLREAAGEERFGGRPLDQVAKVMLGIWHSFFVNWLFSGSEGRLADQASAAAELILYGVCGKPQA